MIPAGCITSPPGGPTAHPRRRYTPAVRDTFPRYLGCAPAGGRWVRVDLETGSTFVSVAFGLSWAHDGPRRLMRMSCADGRELSASTSPTRRSTVWSRPPGPASIGRRGLSGSVPPALRFVRDEFSDAGYAPVVTGGVHLVSEYCCSPCHGDDSGTRGPAQPATRTTRVTNPDSSARARLASRTFSAKLTPCRQSSRSSGYAARTAHGTDAQGLRGCPRATSPALGRVYSPHPSPLPQTRRAAMSTRPLNRASSTTSGISAAVPNVPSLGTMNAPSVNAPLAPMRWPSGSWAV